MAEVTMRAAVRVHHYECDAEGCDSLVEFKEYTTSGIVHACRECKKEHILKDRYPTIAYKNVKELADDRVSFVGSTRMTCKRHEGCKGDLVALPNPAFPQIWVEDNIPIVEKELIKKVGGVKHFCSSCGDEVILNEIWPKLIWSPF